MFSSVLVLRCGNSLPRSRGDDDHAHSLRRERLARSARTSRNAIVSAVTGNCTAVRSGGFRAWVSTLAIFWELRISRVPSELPHHASSFGRS